MVRPWRGVVHTQSIRLPWRRALEEVAPEPEYGGRPAATPTSDHPLAQEPDLT